MRITRNDMLIDFARSAAKRSTCLRKNVGAVIARDGRPICVGYNGAPSKQPHCVDVGCLIDPQTGACIRAVHAEANAIAWSARDGIELLDSELYTTVSPCIPCAQLIINAGITWVYYLEEYRDKRGLEILRDARVVCTHIVE